MRVIADAGETNTHIPTKTCTQTLIAASFASAPSWDQPKCPSADEQVEVELLLPGRDLALELTVLCQPGVGGGISETLWPVSEPSITAYDSINRKFQEMQSRLQDRACQRLPETRHRKQ